MEQQNSAKMGNGIFKVPFNHYHAKKNYVCFFNYDIRLSIMRVVRDFMTRVLSTVAYFEDLRSVF